MTTPTVDVAGLEQVLLGRWADLRRDTRAMLTDPRFHKVEGLPAAEHRERVLEQLRLLVAEGEVLRAFPTALGGADDHGGSLARFEELVVADPSLQIKSGVQWGLFASAIMHLGTADHHARLLPGAMSLDVPGVFAMTETGHGSDVASVATTATYDPATQEFVLHTPFRGAWKDYLGNAALHGRAAVVFAQLVTAAPGGDPVNHGVHAFYVPIRDADGRFLPGIGGDDDGLKGGLNGIDNGRLHFDHVRVPRADLLNRYGDVAADGTYSSPIASPGRRFFTMLTTLVQGRVSLDGAAVNASKLALIIAVTYGNQRRQFTGASDVDEVVLLDRPEHQRRLLPRLAQTYAQAFAHERLLVTFDEVVSGRADSDADRQDLETIAAALKPASTWHALDTLQAAREACGGAGFLTENRLTSLRADLDVYVTFEGDNTVLLQLVAKRLLADVAAELGHLDAGTMARLVAERAADAALHRTPLARVVQTLADGGDVRRSAGQLRSTEAQRELLTDRVETMVAELATALRPATKAPRAEAAALLDRHQHALIEAATGARRPAPVGGVHRGPGAGRRPRHPAGAHLAARPVRPDAHRAQPGLVPDPRPALGRAGAGRRRRTSSGCSSGCARTPRTWSTRSATAPSTCGPRSRRAPRPSARRRPAPMPGPSAPPAPRPAPRRRRGAPRPDSSAPV